MQKLVKAAAGKAKGKGGGGSGGDSDVGPGGLTNPPDPLASPWAQVAASGATNYDPTASPWAQAFIGNYVPPKIKGMIEAYQGALNLLTPKIAMAEFLSGWGSSEGGSSLGPMEIAEQLFLNQQLLANLEGMVPWLKKGIGHKKTGPKAKKAMRGPTRRARGQRSGRLRRDPEHEEEDRRPDDHRGLDRAHRGAGVQQGIPRAAAPRGQPPHRRLAGSIRRVQRVRRWLRRGRLHPAGTVGRGRRVGSGGRRRSRARSRRWAATA